MIIGLTGGAGSGKSTVASLFHELGAYIIDADKIVHHLLLPNQPLIKELIQHFGQKILAEDETLDRFILKKIILADPKERLWLEKLIHPKVKDEICTLAKANLHHPYIIAEIPLLIEAGFQDVVDRILVIDCSPMLQTKRLISRDNLSKEIILSLLAAQTSREIRLSFANDIILNEGSLEELQAKVTVLHENYIKLNK